MTDSVIQRNTTTRVIDLSAQVEKSWGVDWSRPEVVYQFANGRQFLNTDRQGSGIYVPPGS